MRFESLVAAIILCLTVYVSVFAQSVTIGTVTTGSNLRAGPGVTYAITGKQKAGDTVTIVGQSADKTWYKLGEERWIAAFLVKVIGTTTPASTPTITGTRPTSTPSATLTATPKSTKTPVPTSTPLPTVATLTGALGQPKAWWESQYGEGVDVGGYLGYGNYAVLFSSDKTFILEYQWDTPVNLKTVLDTAKMLIPGDSQFIKTYVPADIPEKTVNLYHSEMLKLRFDKSSFSGANPGDFIVEFNTYETGIQRLIIGLGNNP